MVLCDCFFILGYVCILMSYYFKLGICEYIYVGIIVGLVGVYDEGCRYFVLVVMEIYLVLWVDVLKLCCVEFMLLL